MRALLETAVARISELERKTIDTGSQCAEREASAARSEVVCVRTDVNRLSEALTSLSHAVREEVTAMRTDMDRLHESAAPLGESLSRLQPELHGRLDTMSAALGEELRSRCAALQSTANAEQQFDGLRAELSVLREALSRLQPELQRQLDSMSAAVEGELTSRCAAVQSTASAEQQFDGLRTEMNVLSRDVAVLSRDMQTRLHSSADEALRRHVAEATESQQDWVRRHTSEACEEVRRSLQEDVRVSQYELENRLPNQMDAAVRALVSEQMDSALRQLRAQLDDAINSLLNTRMDDAFRSYVPSMVDEALRTSVPALVNDALRTSVQPIVSEALRHSVPPLVTDALRTSLPPLLNESLHASLPAYLDEALHGGNDGDLGPGPATHPHTRIADPGPANRELLPGMLLQPRAGPVAEPVAEWPQAGPPDCERRGKPAQRPPAVQHSPRDPARERPHVQQPAPVNAGREPDARKGPPKQGLVSRRDAAHDWMSAPYSPRDAAGQWPHSVQGNGEPGRRPARSPAIPEHDTHREALPATRRTSSSGLSSEASVVSQRAYGEGRHAGARTLSKGRSSNGGSQIPEHDETSSSSEDSTDSGEDSRPPGYLLAHQRIEDALRSNIPGTSPATSASTTPRGKAPGPRAGSPNSTPGVSPRQPPGGRGAGNSARVAPSKPAAAPAARSRNSSASPRQNSSVSPDRPGMRSTSPGAQRGAPPEEDTPVMGVAPPPTRRRNWH